MSNFPIPTIELHSLRTCRTSKFFVLFIVCTLIVLGSGVVSLSVGEKYFSPAQVIDAFSLAHDSIEYFIIADLRLPRLLIAILVGASLGMAGSIVQSITRNPLGSPDLMGVSAGASFAIVVSMAWASFTPLVMLGVGTVGGFLAGFTTFLIAWKTRLSPMHLTLSGMCIALFFNAAIILLLITAKADANGVYFWLTGSLMDRTWPHVYMLVPFTVIGVFMGILFSKPLNLLMLDDATSQSLGLNSHYWRLVLGGCVVILTAATVAVAGPISFVGLVAPHITRLWLMKNENNKMLDHRVSLPASALVGAALVALADAIAKFNDVPVGILCILVGGPVFVHLIRKAIS